MFKCLNIYSMCVHDSMLYFIMQVLHYGLHFANYLHTIFWTTYWFEWKHDLLHHKIMNFFHQDLHYNKMYNFHFNHHHKFQIIIAIKHVQKLEWFFSGSKNEDFLIWSILKHTKKLKAFREVFGRKKHVQIF
jgi:hypothetical protein